MKILLSTYLTRHTVLSDIYILLVASAEVSLVLDSLVVDRDCTDSTVYQLYTGRVYHRTRATCDRGCTADKSHWWGDTPSLGEVKHRKSDHNCCSDIEPWRCTGSLCHNIPCSTWHMGPQTGRIRWCVCTLLEQVWDQLGSVGSSWVESVLRCWYCYHHQQYSGALLYNDPPMPRSLCCCYYRWSDEGRSWDLL